MQAVIWGISKAYVFILLLGNVPHRPMAFHIQAGSSEMQALTQPAWVNGELG